MDVKTLRSQLQSRLETARRIAQTVAQEVGAQARMLDAHLRIRRAHGPQWAKRTRAIHAQVTLGERMADGIAAGMGSWRFILIQTAIVGLWIALNLVAVALRWDPYPFILLNLLFSTQAAYAAPIIMMSQNRQSARDRVRDDLEASEVDGMSRAQAALHQINVQQLAILQKQNTVLAQQTAILEALHPTTDPTASTSAPPPAPIQIQARQKKPTAPKEAPHG